MSRIGKVIRAIATGTLMLGATMSGAFAANLQDYPAPFIKDGKFSGVMVIGDKAAAEDVIGLSDIAVGLQFAAAQGGIPSDEVSSDAWKVGTSTKMLEMSENLEGTSVNRESISSVISGSYISEPELEILKDGVAVNSKGNSPYHQRLYFEDSSTGYVVYTENNDDATADFLFFDSGKNISKYELEFTTSLESDVEDASGSSDTTGLFLTDIEDVNLKVLGREYTIVQARRLSSTGNNAMLILMGGAMKDTLNERQTKTYAIKGIDYEVTLNYVDSDEAQFTVNGQNTRKLKDGDTDKLSDGTTIGVTDILYQDYQGGIHSTTFFIGANKLELRDSAINDTASSNSLKVDDETIDNANVVIEGTDDDSTFKINRITVAMEAEDDLYIPAGGRLSEAIKAEGDEPEVLFTENWDIEYAGLSKELSNKVRIRSSSSDQYKLEFVDWSGNKADFPLASTNSTAVKLGDDDDNFVFQENVTITKDDYFVVTDGSDQAGERPTYVLRYRGSDKDTADNKVLKFDDVGTGDRMEVPYSVQGGTSPLATLKIGGGSYQIRAHPQQDSTTDVNDFDIRVDLDQDGTFNETDSVSLTTNYGAQIRLVDSTPNSINVSISTPNANHFDSLTPTSLNFTIVKESDGDVDINKNSGGLRLLQPEGEDDISYGYTSYGAFIKFEEPTNGESSLEITYPRNQLEPKVYIKAVGAKIGDSNSVEEVAKTDLIKKIEVGAAKLASEVSDVKAQNVILVGGPCANAATATIMGNPADCTEGFEPGMAKIKVFEHANGNLALLVAGYSGIDTRNAAAVLADYKNYKGLLTGKDIVVKKVINQLTIATASS